MHKLIFFIPEKDKERVKTALFKEGAGKIGNYSECCFESQGIGQFRPLNGSNPSIGKELELEKLSEWKVEMVCEDHLIETVVAALKLSHPYETPAFEVYKLTQT